MSNAVVIDVKSPEEWRKGHIRGAILNPIDDIAAGKAPDLPKNTKIYLYCRTGSRAGMAQLVLEKQDFTDVTNIGSLENATQLGPIVTGN